MRLVLPTTQDESQEFADWLARQHGKERWTYPGLFYGYGFKNKDDEIVGAAVLEPFHAETSFLINISIDTPLVMRHRHLINKVFEVPFSERFNATRLSVIIHDKYTRTIRVAKNVGFEIDCVLKNHFGSENGVLMSMAKNHSRLATKNGWRKH